jgi:type IV pilus assembly protein PilM
MAQRIVGLDIGTSALRAVELVVDNGSRPVLEAYGQVGLSPGVVVDGEVRDRAQVAAAIRRLWREGGFRTNQVHLGVAGLRAITREMEMPPLPPEELNTAVILQAEDILPFPVERTAIASTVISRTEDADGLPLIRVLVAAAHRDVIDGVVSVVEEAGLEPVAVDLDTAALSRAFTLPGAGDEPEAVVSVGAGLTMVIVHHGGQLQFVRTIDLGGDTVTRAVSGALDVPFVDAESTKRQLADPGQHDPTALRAAANVVDDLVSEIHNSIRYYASLPGRSPIARVLITGGGIRTVGLMEKIRTGLDVPVLEASPLSFVDVSRLGMSDDEARSINPTVAVPIGLALNGPSRTRFELMPHEVLEARADRRTRKALIAAAVVLVVLLGAVSAWRLLAVRSTRHQVASLQQTVHYINTVEIPRYDKAVRLGDSVSTLENQLKPLVAHEVDWLTVLGQLGQYLPSTASLDEVNLAALSPVGITASGTAKRTGSLIGTGSTTVATKDLTEVTQFGLMMAKSHALSNVAVSGAIAASATSVHFPVTFGITKAAHGQRTRLFDQRIP